MGHKGKLLGLREVCDLVHTERIWFYTGVKAEFMREEAGGLRN